MRKLIINENQHKIYESYKSSFDINTLKELPYCDDRKKYCSKHLKFINKGTSRYVYELDDTSVLKLAIKDVGLEQNKVEYNTFKNNENNNLFAKVLYSEIIDGYHFFNIMEKVKIATESDFMSIGVNFNEVFQGCDETAIRVSTRKDDLNNKHHYFCKSLQNIALVINNSMFTELVNNITSYIISNDLIAYGDICEISNWGVSKDRLVLLDYGMDNNTFYNYYM